MQRLHVRLTVRRMMLAVAGSALALGILVACLRWLTYPHVKLTIFNESSTALLDVRIKFLYGERKADRIEPGTSATTEIQSGGESGVFISFKDSSGILRKDEPIYYSDSTASPDRGFAELHIANESTRLVKQIYNFDFDIPIWTIRVMPAGQMTLK
jgi:hypothetical protein